MNPPAITVITPLLNRAGMLPDALASLATQNAVDVEHVVVDGGSTDGSQSIARAGGAIVIDAPGTSIYEAINLGLTRARGELICLLNSDDRLADDALETARAEFSDGNLELVRGRALVERLEDGHRHLVDDGRGDDPQPTLRKVLLAPANINACMFRAALVQRVGPFDTKYRIASDREWLARVMLSGAATAGLDQLLYVYGAHADSATIGGGKAATEKWVREHLAFARQLLQRHQLSSDERDALLAFHAKESAHLAVLMLRNGRAPSRELSESFATNALWPLHAASPLASIAWGRLRRAVS